MASNPSRQNGMLSRWSQVVVVVLAAIVVATSLVVGSLMLWTQQADLEWGYVWKTPTSKQGGLEVEVGTVGRVLKG
jgi:hypothetical protein